MGGLGVGSDQLWVGVGVGMSVRVGGIAVVVGACRGVGVEVVGDCRGVGVEGVSFVSCPWADSSGETVAVPSARYSNGVSGPALTPVLESIRRSQGESPVRVGTVPAINTSFLVLEQFAVARRPEGTQTSAVAIPAGTVKGVGETLRRAYVIKGFQMGAAALEP